MTKETQEIDETPTKVQAVDVPVQPREGAPHPCSTRPYSKRTKKFYPKEDEVVVSAWLNVSKDPVHGLINLVPLFGVEFMLTMRKQEN